MPSESLVQYFDARSDEHVGRVAEHVVRRYASSQEARNEISISPAPNLFGIAQEVYQQIEHLLKTKRHLLFYGPPGTGKTTLAEHVARQIGDSYQLITASADWSSQDIIGGYQPVGGGDIAFAKGILLEHFDKPIIIDELNRTDIDKVLGPLFTVLSGHSVTLPYSTNLGDPEAPRYRINANPGEGNGEPHEFSPQQSWRLMATINTADKASLYQMSYALSRRFGWVFIDVPEDKAAFLKTYIEETTEVAIQNASSPCSLARVWKATEKARSIGPAPFIDIIDYCTAAGIDLNLFGNLSESEAEGYAEGYGALVVPMLDGITRGEAEALAENISEELGLTGSSEKRFRRLVNEVAV